MRKYLMPIYVVLFLIGATALWYFGHHRPAQKILKAEPKRVYKSTPLQPADLSVKPTPSDATQEPRENNIDIETENTDPAATHEKLDNNRDRAEVTDVDELVIQEGLSVEDAATEAYEKYLTAESEYQAAQEALNKTLNFDQILSAQEETQAALEKSDHQAAQEALNKTLNLYNFDQIMPALEAFKEARLRRNEALENLAAYSENAAKMLAQVKEDERRTEERKAEYEAESARYDATIRELEAEARELEEMLEKLRPE